MNNNLSEQWVQYNKATGAIEGVITATSDVIGWQGSAYGFIKHAGLVDDMTHYIDLSDLQVKNRQDYSFDSFPTPCLIYIDEVEYSASALPQISFATDGIYDVGVKPSSVTCVSKVFQVSQLNGVISVLSEEVVNANFAL